MIKNVWGKKVGMTQVFTSNNKVIPATVIYLGDMIVLQRKTTGRDGYEAVQIGCPRKEAPEVIDSKWIHTKKNFSYIRELRCEENDELVVGQKVALESISMQSGFSVKVTGVTIGKGFQGVVKRYGFTGGRASHGDKLGRGPGSLSGLRKQGRVFKGKKMPGHMGCMQKTISNLEIVHYRPEEKIIVIKGSVPGKAGSLVYIEKCD